MNWLLFDKRTDTIFYRDVISGLSSRKKSIPSKYLYDRRGSELFDQICELDEYYLTRTETAIMQCYGREMGRAIGRRACLVELGSGSSTKTRLLLRQLEALADYVPLDISADYLYVAADRLRQDFPELSVRPHVADFTEELSLPELGDFDRLVFYFPGSTIGNLSSGQSRKLLEQMSGAAGTPCGLLIGIDLQKDPTIIEAAYNDAQGVTASFSKNLLTRINRELEGNFNCDLFEHAARYDRDRGLVDIGLVSQTQQRVVIGERTISFGRGEAIHTETSRKYRLEEFCGMASQGGFHLVKSWTDPRRYFAVLYLET